MSRLDDELKLMFQRQEPSADFSERLLARIQEQAPPRLSLWQRLLGFFQPNALPWALAAAAVLLAAIIGFTQYRRLTTSPSSTETAGPSQVAPADEKVATMPSEKQPGSEVKEPEKDKPAGGIGAHRLVPVKQKRLRQPASHKLKYVKTPASQELLARQQRAAGEAAKEQLLKALFIASATVNEARKLAIGDD
jgi:hypothetical protein